MQKGNNKNECVAFPFQVVMSDYLNMDTNNIISKMKILHEYLTIFLKVNERLISSCLCEVIQLPALYTAYCTHLHNRRFPYF
jgi:hypothetical protein